MEENYLTSLSVSAHKKQNKKGDRFILWITGSNLGCYALGTITSDVYKGYDSGDREKYYPEDGENIEIDRCDIKVDISLVDDPISLTEVKSNAKLQNLKVGYQGTNFSATVNVLKERD